MGLVPLVIAHILLPMLQPHHIKEEPGERKERDGGGRGREKGGEGRGRSNNCVCTQCYTHTQGAHTHAHTHTHIQGAHTHTRYRPSSASAATLHVAPDSESCSLAHVHQLLQAVGKLKYVWSVKQTL